MKTIIASAPGKAILFGEHAVVYNKLGIACSLGRRCKARVSFNSTKDLLISSANLKLEEKMEERELDSLFKKTNLFLKENNFEKIKDLYDKSKLTPAFFVAASIFNKYRFLPLRIEIDSEVPKNLGSSSSAFSALSLAILTALDHNPKKKEISDFAFLGDVLTHGGTPSGIDNAVVSYGGYISFRKTEGIKPLQIDFRTPFLIVDSKEEAKTAKTVSFVRKLREEKRSFVDSVLDDLDGISKRALSCLKEQNIGEMGELMTEYYYSLKRLNISTERLDEIISLALVNKALGAKPTGGWGGGCCLILQGKRELKELFKEKGFDVFSLEAGVEGVKLI